ncbi:MAG: alpha/beta hydrolase [Gemmatimonadaceae bacterium]
MLMTSLGTDRTTASVATRATVLGVSLLLALLAVISVMPAWSMSMLPFVLATSELSPLLAVLTLVWLLVSRRFLARHRAWRAAVTVALLGTSVLTLRPLVQARHIAHRAQSDVLATDATGALPPGARTTLSFAGLPSARDVREQDVGYVAADGSPLAMRVFRNTEARGVQPILVVLYGGAWRGGDPMQGARVSRALAQHGYVVVAIDYRHAPRFTHPAQLDDVRRSLALVRDSAVGWHGDAARIALLGRSAGGHLAELAAYAPGDPPVQAVVALYAPWNLADGYRDVPTPDPIGVRGVIGNFIGGTPDAMPARYRDASPSSYVRPGLPPTLLLFGSRDHLVKPEFNRAAAMALRAARGRVIAVELPWSEHGFDLVPAGLGERLAYRTIVAFLDRELVEARAVSRRPR